MRDDVCSMDQGKEVRNSKWSIPHNKVYCRTRPYLSATPWFSLMKILQVPHCAQWFYFQVVHAVASIPYTISIVNFVKPESLYQEGMRPLLYSRIDEKKSSKGWFRVGEKIEYFANNRKFKKKDVEQNYHSLRFTMSVSTHEHKHMHMHVPTRTHTWHPSRIHILRAYTPKFPMHMSRVSVQGVSARQ